MVMTTKYLNSVAWKVCPKRQTSQLIKTKWCWVISKQEAKISHSMKQGFKNKIPKINWSKKIKKNQSFREIWHK